MDFTYSLHMKEMVLKVDDSDKAVWDLMTNVPRVNKMYVIKWI